MRKTSSPPQRTVPRTFGEQVLDGLDERALARAVRAQDGHELARPRPSSEMSRMTNPVPYPAARPWTSRILISSRSRPRYSIHRPECQPRGRAGPRLDSRRMAAISSFS
ncbi:MAG: hypothetical protein MZV64_49445 [Ignavibacteriales bacterium]|nr:hypothetical protein [Ignavibacteriales bacterium]